MSSFMGPDKASSSVTTSSNRTSLLWCYLLEGEWGNPGWRAGRMIARGQYFIPGAGARFWLSTDFVDSCHMWDARCHTYDMSIRFFPCRVYTDSNHHDTLRYEWPLVCCYHLVVCLVVLMAWIRGCWLWLCLSWWLLYYFTYDVDYFIDVLFVYACYSL
jgi:hypothetical protein